MTKPRKPRPVKEAYFVRVPVDGDRALFFDATSHLGKILPYKKPQASCFMRVEVDRILFSLLHIPKKAASDFVSKPVKIPRAPFSRMEAYLDKNTIEESIVDVEIKAGDDTISCRFELIKDENGVGRLEVLDGFGSGEEKNMDPTFSLPSRSLEVRLYLQSRVGRTLAVNFVGHIGKPGGSETVARSASMVLNSICGLNEFRTLSGLETMKVPAPPTRWASKPVVRKAEDRVLFDIALQLFTPEYQPVGAGRLGVEIDLDSSNQATGRLLFHLSPSENIEEIFGPYKKIVDEALGDALRKALGEQIEMVVIDIVLGEISSGSIDMLKEAASSIFGIDATPKEYRFHDAEVTVA